VSTKNRTNEFQALVWPVFAVLIQAHYEAQESL
jgi:hypothetical protein